MIPNAELSHCQRAIIIGSLLGDACLERNGKHYRLRIEHGRTQKAYVLWKCKMFTELLTEASPMQVKAFHLGRQRTYESWRAYTKSLPVFDGIGEAFYHSRRKVIPRNLTELLTDPLSLAVWHMDDGYKRSDCNAFRINTDSFSEEEQEILRETMAKNFGIQCSVHKKGKYRNLYIPKKSARQFVELVKPHVLPSLLYKIALAP